MKPAKPAAKAAKASKPAKAPRRAGGGRGVLMILAAILGTGLVALTARAKIGGQTGDVLGAAQQISLTFALALAT